MFTMKSLVQVVLGVLVIFVAGFLGMLILSLIIIQAKPQQSTAVATSVPQPTQTPLPATQQVIETALLKVGDMPSGWFVQTSAATGR